MFANRLREFSDYSTMHGFREIYYAKSLFWKLIWILLTSVMVLLSLYQSIESMQSWVNISTTTVIHQLTGQVQYPPLVICTFHWLDWLDWNKTKQLGFDRNTTLYGLSMLNDIVIDDPINIELTRRKFQEVMKKNNLSKIMQMYEAISVDAPPSIFEEPNHNRVWQKKILEPEFPRMCYILSSEEIAKELEPMHTEHKALVFKSQLKSLFVTSELITLSEAIATCYTLAEKTLKIDIPADSKINYSNIKMSMQYSFIGEYNSGYLISKNEFQNNVEIRANRYQWLNKVDKPCITEVKHFDLEHCKIYCQVKEFHETNPRKCLTLFQSTKVEDENVDVCKKAFLQSNLTRIISSPDEEPNLDQYNASSCLSDCVTPCDQWKYSFSVLSTATPEELTSLTFPTTTVVNYPIAENIIVMTEVPAQTWQSVAGNLGGIIGLWLGASILSLVQMIYLCCCSRCDEMLTTKLVKDRSKVVVLNHINVQS